MKKVKICHFDWWSFGSWNLYFWKEEVKCDLLQKTPPNLAKWFERYGLLKFKNFWKWFDHNLSTIHGNWVFLDFLEMGEQDLQLSCWEKIHLKLVSWCKFGIKKFPFLASFSYRSSFYFWKFLIWLQILPWWYLPWYMRPIWTWISSLKPNPIIKTIKSITVDQVWLFRVSDWLCIDWWLLSIQSLTRTLQMDPQVMWTCWTNPRALAQWNLYLLAWLTDLLTSLT